MDDVYVVGGYASFDGSQSTSILLKRNSADWSAVDVEVQVPLNDVWGTGPSNIYIAGGVHPETGEPSAVALQFDGTHWNNLDIGTTLPLNTVFATNDGTVWFGGEEGLFKPE